MSARRAVSDATGRIGTRRRETRRRRLFGVGAVLVSLVLLGVGYWTVAVSDLLTVREVTVRGSAILSKEQVLAVAAAPYGVPLVWVDLAPMAQRVAELPAVEQVTISRVWPNTLDIEIRERTPVMAAVDEGEIKLVDSDGVVFHTVTERPKGLLVVDVDLGNRRLLVDVARVLTSLPPTFRSRVTSLEARTPDTISMKLDNGAQVVWGSAAESDLKYQVLAALLQVKASVFDVSSPSHPTSR